MRYTRKNARVGGRFAHTEPPNTEHLKAILILFRPHAGVLLALAVASMLLSVLNGATQIALTPLLEIVLGNSGQATAAPSQFSLNLNELGLNILSLIQHATGFTDPWRLLLVSAASYLALTIIGQAGSFISEYWSTTVRLGIAREMEYTLFGHTVRLPLGFLQKQSVGWLQARMVSNVNGAMMMISDLIINGLSNLMLVGFYLILLVRTDLRLTIVAGLAGGAQLIMTRLLQNQVWNRTVTSFEVDAQTNAYRQERLSSLREIKALGGERYEQGRLREQVGYSIKMALRTQFLKQLEWPLRLSINRTVIVVVMAFGAYQLLQGNLTVPAFLLFMYFSQSLVAPLASLAGQVLQITSIRATLEGVGFLLSQKQEHSGTRSISRDDFHEGLALNNVSFSYGDMPVLHNIDLEVKKGSLVALVGQSGAGKSTLVDLILRFFEPTEGTITLDGIPVTEYIASEYRSLFGIVSQEAQLFNATVSHNISYARGGITQEDVERAAKVANAHKFILEDLPQGYEHVLGERGVRLSGGQRQRIAIARAVAHNPAILILDEATSSLDSESERLVQDAIERVIQGSTAIVIAHRLSTVLMADKIVVLREGRIVESGTHKELIKKNGEYRYLYDLQFDTEGMAHLDPERSGAPDLP